MKDVSPGSAVAGSSAALSSPAIDALAVIAGAVIAALLVPSWAGPAAAVTALVVLLALVVWRGILGGSIGHSILRLRSIDALTGLPSFRFLARRRLVRRGGEDDPFALRPRPTAVAAPAHDAQRVEHPRSHLRLVVDDGTSHTIQYAALVGRDPTVPPDTRHTLVAIPDLTRTISKAHLLIAVTDDGLVVTDLRSENGTRVLGTDAPLAPQRPALVPWGATLLLGDRRITLERRQREAS
ncbi:MAG: FHA domain-containing protein [Arachnia sp.]